MKDRIKEWLKAYNHDRAWLADQVGATVKTVNNWLSSPQEIPAVKQRLIEKLMQEDEAAEAVRRQKLQPQAQIFSLEVDLPTFRSYSAAALAAGCTLEQWAIHELNAAAEESMSNPSQPIHPFVYPSSSPGATSIAAEEPLTAAQIEVQAAIARQSEKVRRLAQEPASEAPANNKAG